MVDGANVETEAMLKGEKNETKRKPPQKKRAAAAASSLPDEADVVGLALAARQGPAVEEEAGRVLADVGRAARQRPAAAARQQRRRR